MAESLALEERLDVFEAVLAERLPFVRGLHPAVALALQRFQATSNIRDVVTESGYSHRTFVGLFRDSVGLTPKRYCRVLRFAGALREAAAEGTSFVDLAAAAGYSDQAHLNREFREFAGVTPGEYCRSELRHAHHVPVRSDWGK